MKGRNMKERFPHEIVSEEMRNEESPAILTSFEGGRMAGLFVNHFREVLGRFAG